MSKQMLKAGDQIVFGRGKRNSIILDVTIGKIYTLFEDEGALTFKDDVDDYNYCLAQTSQSFSAKATKIVN